MGKMVRALCIIFTVCSFYSYSEASQNTVNSPSSDAQPFVAVLDMNYIIDQAKASVVLRNQIEEERLKIQEEIKVIEDELRAKEKKLIEEQHVLDPRIAQERKNSLEKEFEQVQEMVGDKKVQISRKLENGMARIQNTIYEIVQKISKERNFSLIIPKNIVIYSVESLDITMDVLEQLNKKLPGLKENKEGN